ncbi:hypothetical protein BUALT_Bualt11G0075100 [Buddleja alternifolia]|uniref:Protein kinase domain-containing protein n=1 Tax=Buddleja alternifolia TaxID=168488 RepID=A0AAV6WZM5_9LAMI|nr:hypothetical protein BUALT_Bualt11G0075100 [Buddleja alternifolia]
MFDATSHFILLHSLPSNKSFSFLGLPPPCAHPHVRAPPPLPSPSYLITMARKRIILSIRSLPLLIVFLHFVASSNASDAENLIKFKGSLQNAAALSNWDISKPPCMGSHENWQGVLCDKGKVWGLKLENMGLGGVIDVDTLAKLPDLRTISVMNNNFEGSLPSISRIGVLKTVYLSNNKFSGEIPIGTFDGMTNLKKIYLANNNLSGSIPASMAALPKLMELMLENNEFSGAIPDFPPNRLKLFNASNNKLDGEIPNSLTNFSASSFDGNENLCGGPIKPCTPNTNTQNSSSKDKLPVLTIILVTVLVVVAIAALVIVVIILRRRKKTTHQPAATMATAPPGQPKTASRDLDRMEQGQSGVVSSSAVAAEKKPEQNVKLTFLKEANNNNFDMPDLLKASAEVLGSGVFGSTYKAALNDGRVMVVKRFKHMNNVNREEFSEHMRRLGRLNHENVVSIVAYYYRKEEKLFVADFVENGSLAVHLHGNRSRGLPSPNWPTRLNIIKGVAKGLQYLYNELPSLTAPHGHLKSSNVLLDISFKPLLIDYGLVPVVNQEHAQDHMISYKSPEYKHNRRITKKTDVWSLGMLILEILTGRFPSNFLQQGSGGDDDTDLATWAESVLCDGGDKTEVFDGDMEGTSHCYGEMMKLLKIGLVCCHVDADKRPDIKEVVDKVEEVKEKDIDDDFYSSYTSETDMRSSRGLSDDFKSINI